MPKHHVMLLYLLQKNCSKNDNENMTDIFDIPKFIVGTQMADLTFY